MNLRLKTATTTVLALGALFLPASYQQIGSIARLDPHQRARGPIAQHSVLLLLLDDLGIDQLGVYGLDRDGDDVPLPLTPNIDALREEGILFTSAYVNPLCSPTRASLVTGRYGFRTGVGRAINNGNTEELFALDTAQVCIAQMLGDGHGPTYARGAFGKLHLAGRDPVNDCDAVFPTNRGFETFMGHTRNNVGWDDELGYMNHYRWRKVAVEAAESPDCPGTTTVPANPAVRFSSAAWAPSVHRADVVDWIAEQSGPFFAMVGFNPPHTPYHVPPFELLSPATRTRMTRLGLAPGMSSYTGRGLDDWYNREVYRAMVEAVDAEIGNLLDGIPADKRANTVVIVLGDNGTDRSIVPDVLEGDSVPAWQGKRGVYELGTRVPLIVAGPPVPEPPPGGWTCDALVAGVDLWRTIGRLSGLSAGRIAAVEGGLGNDSTSFAHLVADPTGDGARSFAYCEEFPLNGEPDAGCGDDVPMRRAITGDFDEVWGTGRWKFVWKEFDDGSTVEELYRLDGGTPDWLEKTNLLPAGSGTADEEAYLALKAAMESLHAGTALEVCQ